MNIEIFCTSKLVFKNMVQYIGSVTNYLFPYLFTVWIRKFSLYAFHKYKYRLYGNKVNILHKILKALCIQKIMKLSKTVSTMYHFNCKIWVVIVILKWCQKLTMLVGDYKWCLVESWWGWWTCLVITVAGTENTASLHTHQT